MKNKRIYSALLTVSVLLGSVAVMTGFGVSAETISEISPDRYYGKNGLAGIDNGANLVEAYERFAAGADKDVFEIKLDDIPGGINENELKVVFRAYREDYPQHFWVEDSYGYTYVNENGEYIVKKVTINTIMRGAELAAAKIEFEGAVSRILSGITSELNEFDRELMLQNRLNKIVTYEEGEITSISHTAYGALILGQAVCDGYSEALQYLLYRSGIEASLMTGRAWSGSGWENHAWLFVKINGLYYYLDPTWNDAGSEASYAYFNLCYRYLSEDHKAEEPVYGYPHSEAENDFYFAHFGLVLDSFDPQRVADELGRTCFSTRIYFGGEFPLLTTEDFRAVGSELGMTGYSYMYSTSGRELTLIYKKGEDRYCGASSVWSYIESGDGGTLYINGSGRLADIYPGLPNMYDGNAITDIVISGDITSIGDYMFFGLSELRSVTLPDTITSIGRNAFSGCSSLREINFIGGSVMTGENAFSGCNLLDDPRFIVRETETASATSDTEPDTVTTEPETETETETETVPVTETESNTTETTQEISSETDPATEPVGTATEETTENEYPLGDVNGDRRVNSIDLTRIMKFVAGAIDSVERADINGDGRINSLDLTRLMKIIAGQ